MHDNFKRSQIRAHKPPVNSSYLVVMRFHLAVRLSNKHSISTLCKSYFNHKTSQLNPRKKRSWHNKGTRQFKRSQILRRHRNTLENTNQEFPKASYKMVSW